MVGYFLLGEAETYVLPAIIPAGTNESQLFAAYLQPT
jgi:hypothetical protein